MILAMPIDKFRDQLFSQINNLWFLNKETEITVIESCLQEALGRLKYCFSFTMNKYYRRDGDVFFNPLHTAQYGIFLYFLSNTIWRKYGAIPICEKIYSLGKVINSLDLYYQVEMPDIFFMDHPVGSVMGRASYGRFFSFSQNCSVGNNKGIYPIIGENVSMHSYSRILGRSTVGSNVVIASGTYIKDQDIPDYSLVFGESPNLIIKTRSPDFFLRAEKLI